MLIEIVKDRKHKDQLKAIIELMNRGGLQVITQHKVIVEDNRSDDEIVARVAAFARNLGLDPAQLLAKVGVEYTDAEFSEVSRPMLESPQKARTSEHDPVFSLEGDDDGEA